MRRLDVHFPVEGLACAAWLYLPDSAAPAPVIVMAHGLGGVRTMRLDAYAARFQAAGYACLVFDYRHFGDSEGTPRQLLSIRKQQQDWAAAIAYARMRPEVDGRRVVVWGSSFSGGHAIHLGATQPGLAAILAQCPFTDGVASAMATSPISSLRVMPRALADVLMACVGGPPVMVPCAAPRFGTGLMTAADCLGGMQALVPPGAPFRNEVAARFVFQIMGYRPGELAAKVPCPAFFALCRHDTVAPCGVAWKQVRQAPRAEVKVYDAGHFDIYRGEAFEQVVGDQLAFLRRTVPAIPTTKESV
jgi:pimeloyl-ACP methyl ester carboxylesterase